jgi:methionyl-tRNA formyltransferase
MGTPDFAATCLSRLIVFASECGHEVVAAFSQPDKKSGRGLKITPTPVREIAEKHGVPVYQPATLRDGEALQTLQNLAPDLLIVVAYGRILPREILELPPLGCVNIHASLLPKFRGSAPIQRAVLNGESVTGVTAMYMAEELDAGDIIAARETAIADGETSGELFARLAPLGAELLCETIAAIADGTAKRTPQNSAEATFAPPLSKAESPVDFTKPARELANQINGLDPWPAATVEFDGGQIKLFGASVSGNILAIREVQAPGGRRMALRDFLRGHPDFAGVIR